MSISVCQEVKEALFISLHTPGNLPSHPFTSESE